MKISYACDPVHRMNGSSEMSGGVGLVEPRDPRRNPVARRPALVDRVEQRVHGQQGRGVLGLAPGGPLRLRSARLKVRLELLDEAGVPLLARRSGPRIRELRLVQLRSARHDERFLGRSAIEGLVADLAEELQSPIVAAEVLPPRQLRLMATLGLGRTMERALRDAVGLRTLAQRCAEDTVLMSSKSNIRGGVLLT